MLTTYKTLLSQKKQLTTDVFLFRFQLIEPRQINFKAGQYLILKIGDKSRLYSIASPDWQKDTFELLVQTVEGGVGSTYLLNLKIGEEAIFQGPAGMFTLKDSPTGAPRPKIFLATGTGLAPVRSMIKSEIKKLRYEEIKKLSNEAIKEENKNPNFSISHFPNFYLFWGLRYFSDVYFLEELKEIEKTIEIKKIESKKFAGVNNPNFSISHFLNFSFKICLSREKNLEMIPEEDRQYFAVGHVNEAMEREIKKIESKKFGGNPTFLISQFLNFFDFYLCGSRQVVESLRQYLEEKGVPASQVFFEKF
ncbi:MAG: FAD-binding oxidoreductase [Microgenomates group bacterium]